MSQAETVAVNLYPSEMSVPSKLAQQDRIALLKNLYGSLTKHIAAKGFVIYPHRPGVRFFVGRDETINIGADHQLVQVQSWSGKINEVRFHDGFVSQIEFIDDKVWLKIDPRQTVLIKGNEQTNADFGKRSSYVSYCPVWTCGRRSGCHLARPKILTQPRFTANKEDVVSLRDELGYGCRFCQKLLNVSSVVEARWRKGSILLPWATMYFKGAITDMPDWTMRKLYQERCLLKSEKRLALTQYAFSILSDGSDFINIPFGRTGDEISFKNMFEDEVRPCR